MQFVETTENQCKETYSSIQNRLAYLKDLSLSNLALKRLIKRNKKREGKIVSIIKNIESS